MALTQVESEKACPTSQYSNKATKRMFVKQERLADLEDRVTLSFRSVEVDVPSECDRELPGRR
jgi:hypothetical protein